ncbi:uncharacterized protein IUM83_06056 [Phytophthora cinnamomi]|uniref:uncharacterized protein n=1 Tax=Phytophthora cinnamomi TaxID=4785 RepID=UPI003559515F|nr:hypothetical protein IUM83_06056 [Phytophthora cinnamomi]
MASVRQASGFFESESEDHFTLCVIRRERQQKLGKRAKWLRQKAKETDNVEQLSQLLNTAEEGFGSSFFADTTHQARVSYGIVEEHWDGIDVDLSAYTTTCRFCAST